MIKVVKKTERKKESKKQREYSGVRQTVIK